MVGKTGGGWEFEVGSGHTDLLIDKLGFQDGKVVSTPGVDVAMTSAMQAK